MKSTRVDVEVCTLFRCGDSAQAAPVGAPGPCFLCVFSEATHTGIIEQLRSGKAEEGVAGRERRPSGARTSSGKALGIGGPRRRTRAQAHFRKCATNRRLCHSRFWRGASHDVTTRRVLCFCSRWSFYLTTRRFALLLPF